MVEVVKHEVPGACEMLLGCGYEMGTLHVCVVFYWENLCSARKLVDLVDFVKHVIVECFALASLKFEDMLTDFGGPSRN